MAFLSTFKSGCAALAVLLSSCIDLSSRELDGPYFVAQDPAAGMTLYYADSPAHDGGFERIRNVQRVGYTREYIFVQSAGAYYAINRTVDYAMDINDPTVLRAIGPAMTQTDFRAFLRRHGLRQVTFQYSAKD